MQVSESTRRELDEAVGLILAEGQALARAILAAHERELEVLAQALLEREVLYEADITALIGASPKRPLPEVPSDHAA